MLTLPAELSFNGTMHQTQAVIDWDTNTLFIDQAFAESLGINTFTTCNNHLMTALERHVLNKDNL